ncbi:nitroreductase family protein [Kiloniella laminariae]|uniref:Nitroreductase family protein n=1 Tax=Kiloniella laminariae TaxID=454162 RepID=A0ABT4LHZ6_9PROT|nr:nitroreductase family protein [Kiloniella laminariae]MCZ4280718.1 nitroreductase family protein [Kiloniella laminariae]
MPFDTNNARKNPRNPDFPVDQIFVERWSPRAYDADFQLPTTDFMTILEAARWAPSCYNIQPWRFLYAFRGDRHWDDYLSLLDPFNAGWAAQASALVIVLSDKMMPGDETRPAKPSGYHSFDTGAAWAQMALQATMLGYQAHAMAGIYHDQIAEKLNIPGQYRVEIAVALGKRSDPSVLPKELQEREEPSQRYGLQEIAFPGLFPEAGVD